MKSLNELWSVGKLPIFSGIIFNDGRVIPIFVKRTGDEISLSKIPEAKYSDYFKGKDNYLLSFDVLDSKVVDEFSMLACGDGSMGGDGFLAKIVNNQPEWVAVFEESNPFSSILVQGEVAFVGNNLNEVWRFFLKAPQDVEVLKKI